MLNPTITTSNAARFFAADRKAKTMFTADRYDWEYETLEAVAVRTPAFPFGEINSGEYTVNALLGTCSCPSFEKSGDFCKHTLAIEELLAEQISHELQAINFEAQMQGCELETTGTDPFAKF